MLKIIRHQYRLRKVLCWINKKKLFTIEELTRKFYHKYPETVEYVITEGYIKSCQDQHSTN